MRMPDLFLVNRSIQYVCLISIGILGLITIIGSGPTVKQESVQTILDREVNKMTFDDAIRTWGPPVSIVQGNEIFVAMWASESNQGAVAMPLGNMTIAVPISQGFNLQLTFDKQSNIMRSWRYREW